MSLEFFAYYSRRRQYCYSMQLDSTIDRDPTQESRFGTPSRDVVRGGRGLNPPPPQDVSGSQERTE